MNNADVMARAMELCPQALAMERDRETVRRIRTFLNAAND